MNIIHRLPVIATMLALLLIVLLPCIGATPAQAEPGSWSSAGSMHDSGEGHTATLLPNGKLLITGGCAGVTLAP